ncbi:hypothetical protein VNO77_18646 [Canavalia gladiata]|uniref:Uncharacterized protein n=1 Tax=Canavalia gladiata TaxID=3824 RepID=A0AAN9LPP1_CANGL
MSRRGTNLTADRGEDMTLNGMMLEHAVKYECIHAQLFTSSRLKGKSKTALKFLETLMRSSSFFKSLKSKHELLQSQFTVVKSLENRCSLISCPLLLAIIAVKRPILSLTDDPAIFSTGPRLDTSFLADSHRSRRTRPPSLTKLSIRPCKQLVVATNHWLTTPHPSSLPNN